MTESKRVSLTPVVKISDLIPDREIYPWALKLFEETIAKRHPPAMIWYGPVFCDYSQFIRMRDKLPSNQKPKDNE